MAETRTRTRTKPEAKAEAKPVPKEKDDGRLTIEQVSKQVAKNYGNSNLISRASGLPDFKRIPTGVFLLDMATSGGIPEGTGTQIFGWESSGKTTLAMRIAANAQKKYPDQKVCYFDFEGTFDPVWAERHYVNTEELFLIQPESGEQGLDIADAVLRAKDTSVVVIDSLPAIVPMREVESSLEDNHVALQARLITRYLRKVSQAFLDERHKGHFPTLLFINQWRTKIGTMHGDPRVLPGGNSMRYVHVLGIEMKNKENTDGKTDEGIDTVDFNEHSFRIHKNKGPAALKSGEFKMIRNPDHPLGHGFIDEADTVVTFARRFGIATGDGSAPKKFEGLDQTFRTWSEAAEYLYQDLDFYEALKKRMIGIIREKNGYKAEAL